MGHAADRVIVKGADAVLGEVHQLVADYKVSRFHVGVQGAGSRRSKHFRDAQALQRPDVGAVVDHVGRHGMIHPVPGQERHQVSAHLADVAQCFAIRRFNNFCFKALQGIGIFDTGSAHNTDFTHVVTTFLFMKNTAFYLSYVVLLYFSCSNVLQSFCAVSRFFLVIAPLPVN